MHENKRSALEILRAVAPHGMKSQRGRVIAVPDSDAFLLRDLLESLSRWVLFSDDSCLETVRTLTLKLTGLKDPKYFRSLKQEYGATDEI